MLSESASGWGASDIYISVASFVHEEYAEKRKIQTMIFAGRRR